jgi:hypothetical protein
MSRLTSTTSTTMSPWVPATRIGGRPRDMLSGARVFAALAALLVLTRRSAA